MNPFYNVFYPENDLSCIGFQTRIIKGRGVFDISCGFSECRVAQFVSSGTGRGVYKLSPYADDERCPLAERPGEIRILDGDFEEYLLIYGCYFRAGQKVEGAYLLIRPGTNYSIKFYKKVLRPVLLVASFRELLSPDPDSNAACNCSDLCNYYDFKGACLTKFEDQPRVSVDLVWLILSASIAATLFLIVVALVWWILKRQSNPFKRE